MGAGVECTISKFADDIELESVVDCFEGQVTLKGDMDRQGHWVMIYRIKFSHLKYQILHLGENIAGNKYKLGE